MIYLELIPNTKSKIYYWQNDVHRRLSEGKILLGGIMSITWCAIRGLFCFGIEDVMPLEDSIIMFDMLDHALANRGEQRQNFFDIVSNIFQRIPNTISSFIAGLSKEKQDQIKDFSQSLSKDQLDAYNNILIISQTSSKLTASVSCLASFLASLHLLTISVSISFCTWLRKVEF